MSISKGAHHCALALGLSLPFLSVAGMRAHAQAAIGGSLTGAITDPTGAAITNAKLTLHDPGTGTDRVLTSNGSGQYAFRDMQPGVYTLRVSAPSYEEKLYQQIAIVLNETRQLNVTLPPGSVSDTVEVTTDQASIVTLSTQVGTLIDEQRVKELPLNGRDFQNLIFLAPGAARTASGTGQGSGVSAAGSRPTNNNYLIDGGDANDPRVPSGAAGNTGSAVSSVPIDAISSFSVITSNASAEFGRSSGGVINVITKSGDNQLHFSVWEFFRNSVLNTRNFFDAPTYKSPFKQNQFGFWAGGYLWKDRTFYSVAYEGFRQRSTTPAQVFVPTVQFINALTNPLAKALFSAVYPPVQGQAVDPNDTSAAGLAKWQGSITRNLANNLDADTGFVRLDQKITDKNKFFATMSVVDSVPASAANGANLPNFGVGQTSRPYHVVGQDDHVFTPTLLNTVRFSYQRTPISYPVEALSSAQTAAGTLRMQGPNAGQPYSPSVGDPNGLPTFSLTSGRFNTFGVASNMPQGRSPEVYTFADSVSWQHGKHEVKFGAQVSRVLDNTTFSNAIRPVVSIQDSTNATAFASINNLTLQSQTESFYLLPSSRAYRLWEQGYFVQDTYRATNRLTLDYGLRYEIFNPFTEANNALSNTYMLKGDGTPDACRPLPFDSSLSGVVVVNPAQYGIGNYCAVYRYVSPRVGFALDVFGTGKTVIRGGYGYFYDRIFGNVYGNARFNVPQTVSTTINTGNYTGAIASSSVNTTATYSLTNIDPSLQNAATHHFNLAISQQIDSRTALTVSYVGSTGQHLLTTTRPNYGTSFSDAFRPSNQGVTTRTTGDVAAGIIRAPFSNMTYRQSNGMSNYNGLLVNVRRAMSKGLSFEGSYTLAHSMDVLSDDVSGSTDAATPQATLENLLAPYMVAGRCGTTALTASTGLLATVRCAEGNNNISQTQAQTLFLTKYTQVAPIGTNYGDSSYDVRQRFAASVIYRLPLGRNQLLLSNAGPVVDRVVGGWGLASIIDSQTGVPFIPTSGTDANRDGDTTDRLTVVGPVAARTGSLTKSFTGSSPLVRYFAACGTGCPFNAGDGVVDPVARMHRGYLRNPGIFNWDFQLNKTTQIAERLNLRFTADFFNVLNHVNFSNLQANISSATFGQSTSQRALGQTQSRQIQFGAKLQF